jgi:hypothetical protein
MELLQIFKLTSPVEKWLAFWNRKFDIFRELIEET